MKAGELDRVTDLCHFSEFPAVLARISDSSLTE